MLTSTNLTYNCRVIEGIEYSDSRRRAHDKNIILRFIYLFIRLFVCF